MTALTELQSASTPLASELMPGAVAQLRAEITRLQRRVFVVESLLKRVSEWERAVIRWVEEEREELVMPVEHDDDEGKRRGFLPARLHSLIENDRLDAYASCVQRILNGELPMYLCNACFDADCGTRTLCPEAAKDGRDAATIFKTRVPEHVRFALEKLLAARSAAEETEFD